MIALLFISVLIFFLLSVPINVSLGLSATLVTWQGDIFSLKVISQQIFNSLNSFPLMAIPFFILAGFIMQHGGISDRLINFATALVGHVSGGLAMVAIVTSMFFAAISGSGAATTAAIGAVLIPAMVAKGYEEKYAISNQAVAGSLGIIIPPSIPLILYGVTANVSVGDLFLAGIFPGLFITLSLLLVTYVYAKKSNQPREEKPSFKALLLSFKRAILSLLMPIIVLGGIYGGIFTPTEAAVVAVVYSFVVSLFVYRQIKVKELINLFTKSAETTSIIMIIIGTAGLFSHLMNFLGIPELISEIFLNMTTSTFLFLIMVNILLLIAGMFIEQGAAILILVPILIPISNSLGIDPIHFGIIMVVNLSIGLVTPPVGINLFVATQISNISLAKLSKAVIPLVLVLIVDVLVISFIPFLSTWLPSFM